MKPSRSGLASLLLLLSLGTAMAEGTKRSTTNSASAKRVVVTGSLIPERPSETSRRPNMTRPTGPVIILTGADIQRIGARDLADALRRGTALAH
jgi:hypothetical protein